MALTKATYTPAASLTFQDATISPATVADGTLKQRFDTAAFPQKGISYSGSRGTVLAAPVLTLGTAGTGGTFAAVAHFWVVASVDDKGGQAKSNEVTATALLNGTQPLSWTAVQGAVSYNLYRGTVAGTENVLVANTTALTFTDTGAAGAAATAPTTNTTGSRVPRAPKTTHGSGS